MPSQVQEAPVVVEEEVPRPRAVSPRAGCGTAEVDTDQQVGKQEFPRSISELVLNLVTGAVEDSSDVAAREENWNEDLVEEEEVSVASFDDDRGLNFSEEENLAAAALADYIVRTPFQLAPATITLEPATATLQVPSAPVEAQKQPSDASLQPQLTPCQEPFPCALPLGELEAPSASSSSNEVRQPEVRQPLEVVAPLVPTAPAGVASPKRRPVPKQSSSSAATSSQETLLRPVAPPTPRPARPSSRPSAGQVLGAPASASGTALSVPASLGKLQVGSKSARGPSAPAHGWTRSIPVKADPSQWLVMTPPEKASSGSGRSALELDLGDSARSRPATPMESPRSRVAASKLLPALQKAPHTNMSSLMGWTVDGRRSLSARSPRSIDGNKLVPF